MKINSGGIVSIIAAVGLAGTAGAQSIVFSTGGTTNLLMGAASRTEAEHAAEIEAADDFLLAANTRITDARIAGLVPEGTTVADVRSVVVRVYRIFPLESNPLRPPQVPTRSNSPGDRAFLSRDANTGLTFTVTGFTPTFTVLNSVVSGINPLPNQTTHGEGPVSGKVVVIQANFTQPIDLPAGHYFFVPQVTLTSGNFLWLESPNPIVSPGTPFASDQQAWIRDSRLNPDWLRIGTDIVGGSPAPVFNMLFLLEGTAFCYPNCDNSTATPILNVNDFVCFNNLYATGSSLANCDGSTMAPILNVNDFICFMNKFAAGCP